MSHSCIHSVHSFPYNIVPFKLNKKCLNYSSLSHGYSFPQMHVPASPRPSDTFLSEFGSPTLLWRVLQSVEYTEPPQYSWWEVDMTGDLQWFAV